MTSSTVLRGGAKLSKVHFSQGDVPLGGNRQESMQASSQSCQWNLGKVKVDGIFNYSFPLNLRVLTIIFVLNHEVLDEGTPLWL